MYVDVNNTFTITGIKKNQYIKIDVTGSARKSVTVLYVKKKIKSNDKIKGKGKKIILKVKAKKAATGKKFKLAVTVYNNKNKKIKKISKTVSVYAKTTAVTVSGASKVTVGEKITLKAARTPKKGGKGKITWNSSDKNIATVSSNGTVTGVAAGEVTITAKADNKSASMTITVIAKESGKTEDEKKNDNKNEGGTAVTRFPSNIQITTPKIEETITATVVPAEIVIKAVRSVSLNNEAPKVDDTIIATVVPSDADDVKYAWYTGDSSENISTLISDQTSNTLKVTPAMEGKYIKVIVSGKQGSAIATTAAPVEKVKKAVESVSFDISAPEMGDTITAIVSPSDADVVSYTWYAGSTTEDAEMEVIEGETANTLVLQRDDMDLASQLFAEKYIKVVVKDALGNEKFAITGPVYPAELVIE